MIKPKQLKQGDTIAIIAPSWQGNEVFPHIVEKGIERLEKEFKFKIKRGKTLNQTNEQLYENPKLRAEDIHEQFLDKNVKGIITIIGGDESIRVLEHINPKIIKNNPKFFMGYSDIATFNTYFNQLGLVTFNGPVLMAGFAESKNLELDFIEHINNFIFKPWQEFQYKKFNRYTNKYLDWNDPNNLNKENTNYIKNNDNWHFIQGTETTNGELFGGCIEIMEMMKGTKYWPELSFWKNKILFLETSEEKPSVIYVEFWLRNYGIQGIFNQINGLIFGRARDYTEEEKIELEKVILKVLKEFNKENLPVITNMDFGHTDPQFILPLGIKAQINPKEKSFKLIESIWNN